MPTIKSAEKRLRQSRKRREHNQSIRSGIRTLFHRIEETDSVEDAEELLQQLYARLDRAAGKDVIHPNKAARKKSQAARMVEEMQS